MSYIKFHEIDENPETNAKLAEIVASLEADGWQGLPLLADGEQLLNGCHRYTACEILGIEPEVHQIEVDCKWRDSEYTDYLLGNLSDAFDTESIYKAIRALHDEGLVDDLALAIAKAEYDNED